MKIIRPSVVVMVRDIIDLPPISRSFLIFIVDVQAELTVGICHHRLVVVTVCPALTGLAGLFHRQVVGSEDHILRRNGNGTTVDGLEEVVGGEHEESRLCLSLCGQRNVYRHLVAVKVGVERRADERVQLYRSAVNEHGLETPVSTDGAA